MPTSGIIRIPCADAAEGVVQLPANPKRPSKLSGACACRAARRKVLEHVALGHRVVQRKSPPLVSFTSLPVASLLSPATAAASSPISMEAMSPSPPLGEGTGHQPSVILRQPGVPPKQRLLWMMALVARSIDMPFPPCVGGYGGIASCSRIH